MNRKEYKQAFDSVRFSPAFEQETAELLRRAARQEPEKERKSMKKPVKRSLLVAAILVVLAVSVTAAVFLLQPKDVAAKVGDSKLSQAFASEDAVPVNAHTQSGGYNLSLDGIVSGKDLSAYYEADESRSYAVFSVAMTDGSKIESVDEMGLNFSPLIAGYKPWQVNGWTLGGGYQAFVYEGVYYAIFDCADLEVFADHTVYLAAYEGGAPSAELFEIAQDGAITFKEGLQTPHALFTLPLDKSKADPAAAKALLDATGMISDAPAPAQVPSNGDGLEVQVQ